MSYEEYFKDWVKTIPKKELFNIIKILNNLYKRGNITPSYTDIFKAFTLCSLSDCKVIMLGQDPYPQKGVATGLAFANNKNSNIISPSLEILKEAAIDFTKSHNLVNFDITLHSWAKQGVLLLNSALTCEINNPNSHTMLWRPFISKFLENLSNKYTGLIYVLLGNTAKSFKPYINKFNIILESPHPSYYARNNMRMPSDLFYTINKELKSKYGETIKWYEEF